MEEREEIQVVIRKEVLIRGVLYLLNKEGLINNKTYLATLEYLENETNANLIACKLMLRNCKVDVVVFASAFDYNEIITIRRIS